MVTICKTDRQRTLAQERADEEREKVERARGPVNDQDARTLMSHTGITRADAERLLRDSNGSLTAAMTAWIKRPSTTGDYDTSFGRMAALST